MLRYLAAARILRRRVSGRVDNFMFFLHYRLSFALFMICSALITAKEYFGNPIACYSNSKGTPGNVLNTYCFFMSTFSVPKYNATSPRSVYPGVGPHIAGEDDVIYRSYYQWVPLMLFLQGASFYLPRYVWKCLDGGLFTGILQGLDKFSLDSNKKDVKFKILLRYMVEHFNMHRNWALRFFLCELLCLVVVVSNIYLTDAFLGGTFMTYGLDALTLPDMNAWERVDPMHNVFPRMTKCTFLKFGTSGSLETHDSMCVLPVNVFNTQAYILIWFWMVFVAVVTAVWLLCRIVIVLSKPLRTSMLSYRGRLAGKTMVEYVGSSCPLGDWFLLYHLGSCVPAVDFAAFLREYSKVLKNLEKPQPSAPSPLH